MKNGLVILNYNDALLVEKLLFQILDYKYIFHIVVVDNCSTDASFSYLQKFQSSKCSVIKTKKNLGYAYGNNIGSKYLIDKYKVDLVFISNPDVIFKEKLLLDIAMQFEKRQEFGLISALQYSEDERKCMFAYDDIPTYFTCLMYTSLFIWGIRSKICKKTVDTSKEIIPVGMVGGAFFGIRANALKEIDFMDENTFLYMEEAILARRLLEKGYKEGIITNNYYIHLQSKTINKNCDNKQRHKWGGDSKIYYLKAYCNAGTIQIFLFEILWWIRRIEYPIYEIYKKTENIIRRILF